MKGKVNVINRKRSDDDANRLNWAKTDRNRKPGTQIKFEIIKVKNTERLGYR